MYKLTGILLILIIVAFGGYSWWQSAIEAATTIKAPTNQGLVGYWSFEEATGTKATDFSGKGNMGTLTGMANPATATSGWGSGRLGGGLNFDGVNDFVSVPTISISSGITVSAWVYSSNFNQTGFIVGKNPVNSQWELFFENTNLIWRGSANNYNVACNGGTSNNAWHHIVGKQTGNQGTLYIDGVQCVTADTSAPIGNGAGVVEIGRFNDGYYFSGSIDEVRIYNRALSADEITKLYQSGAAKINASQNSQSTNGLVGEWSFNGLDVTDKVYDRSGQGNNGYFIGGATSSAKTIGKVGQALSFDGVDDWVDVGNVSSLSFERTNTFSISAWYKAAALNPTTEEPIAAKINLSPDYRGWELLVNGILANDPYQFLLRNGGANIMHVQWPRNNDTNWHHVTVTYNGNSLASGVTAYVDGVVQTKTVTADALSATILNSETVKIGARGTATPDSFTKSTIDEVRIYNRALSAAEITKLYQSGAAKINASQNGYSTDGLVGEWSFNGLDVTDKVYDRSGQGNNGYFIGGATSSAKVIGKVGQALNFNGTTNYISAAAADTNYLGAITIAAWVKPTDNVGSNIASKCLNNGATYNMFDFALTTISSVKVFYSVRAGTGSYRSYKGASWTTGVWQHVVVTYANGNLATAPIYYLNGVAASATVINAGTGTVAGNGKPILLGARDDTKGTTGLKGSLDEVRIYNRALTAGEILLLYNLGR